MRILVLNWQDFTNPQAGGAELHLQEIFSRIVARGHSVDLLCSSWANVPQRVTLGGIEVHRVGTRHTYPFVAQRYYRQNLARNDYDVVVEDLNKVPLYTPMWGVGKLVVLVHHRGRSSGKEYVNPMMYLADEESPDTIYVFASKGGADVSPDWYRNLVADPNVRVQVQDKVFDATARTADPAEKPALWSLMAGIWPDYDNYQTRTIREIPVVILEPVTSTG